MEKFDLDTPCIVIDLDILEDNLGRMQAGATAAGKNLRPHAKSHKCSTLASQQLEHGAIGIGAAKARFPDNSKYAIALLEEAYVFTD